MKLTKHNLDYQPGKRMTLWDITAKNRQKKAEIMEIEKAGMARLERANMKKRGVKETAQEISDFQRKVAQQRRIRKESSMGATLSINRSMEDASAQNMLETYTNVKSS